MAMTFGIHVGHMGGPLEEIRRLWQFADAMGFDWFSVSDHFQESPPQGGDQDCFESTSIMTAAALDTRHIRIGSLVYCINYRNPGVFASAITSIDHLSNGRVERGMRRKPCTSSFGISRDAVSAIVSPSSCAVFGRSSCQRR